MGVAVGVGVVGVGFPWRRPLLSGRLQRLDDHGCFGCSLLSVLVYLRLCDFVLPGLGSLRGI